MSEQNGQGYQGPQGYVAPTYSQTPYGAVASTYEREPVMRRPGTATAAGILTAVLASLYTLLGIGLLIGAVAIGSMGSSRDPASALYRVGGGVLAVVGIFLIIPAVFYLVLGVLVLKRHQWARVTLTVLLALGVLGNIGGLSREHGGWGLGLGGGGLVVDVVLLVLLWVPSTTAWFNRRAIVAPPVYRTYRS